MSKKARCDEGQAAPVKYALVPALLYTRWPSRRFVILATVYNRTQSLREQEVAELE
jgi:hypothetical protein